MKNLLLLLLLSLTCTLTVEAQKKKNKKSEETAEEKSMLDKTSFGALKFRSVGPALTSGRIADFAVVPESPKKYYVAVASGGVWKTENAGNTYKPIFDSQGSYSIGCLALDPSNSETLWVGTGENNNQRSVAFGDGIYVSHDGGSSWHHKGLKNSEHIGKIIVHPDDPNTIFVAAIGPLWSKGGDRGVYKSTDGGETWEATLTVDEHTGVNDIIMDTENPNILYAAAHQRRRHVFTYIGGGPGSAIYKSTDGGETWNKSSKGLPGVDIGRIGFSQSPADPNIIYAIVEAAEGKGGLFRSTNKGASWQKRGGYSSSGNYYQEIIADLKDPNKLYSMNTWMSVSKDGGKSFQNVGEDAKHVDNHCMWIDPSDTDHWLVGCDGGIYETWDAAKHWHFKANLPVTQFYKVAVDNAEPFYFIYGGTQDNFSIGGPSRTISGNGIANDEWFITHGGDGFESQVDPENPNIVYAQSQYGYLVRYDKESGEEIGIKPMPQKDENQYRWNWDAPLAVSAHKSGRLYFAANKVFRSDDRGNSWETISDDLTAQINRNELKVMDRVWPMDAVMKNQSTSPYGTIVALSESPMNENLMAIGTDDGLIQITENGGESWKKIGNIPGVPARTYVNAVQWSAHDEGTLYACFNRHKEGDFKPYVFVSKDRGATWQSMNNNLPEKGSVYTIAEDHVDKNLLFLGTEYSAFFSNDGGKNWKKLNGGLPTIAVRDIAIQPRENDLILGTFGRGFYVLDDYSVLRNAKEVDLANDHMIYPVRDAYAFEAAHPYGLPGKSFQGDSWYQGDNLSSEALITYYIKEKVESTKDKRKDAEKELIKDKKDVAYPSYEDLKSEQLEESPKLIFTIKDDNGDIVRKLERSHSKGLQRFKWDLRYASKSPVSLSGPSFYNPFAGTPQGALVSPGNYTVAMHMLDDGEFTSLGEPVTFSVKSLNNNALPATDTKALADFQRAVEQTNGRLAGANRLLSAIGSEMRHIKKAVSAMDAVDAKWYKQIKEIETETREIREAISGDYLYGRLDMDRPQSLGSKMGTVSYEGKYSRSAPTETHKRLFADVKSEMPKIMQRLSSVVSGPLSDLRKALRNAGAPYTPNVLPTVE